MSTPEALIKANPLLPAEDFNELRKKGFKHIEEMGSAVWTDYNNSDPGITMLDAISYAITDLAYRTGFDIKDLLAPKQLTPETWKEIFYTAREIFHNTALTINDYRKLIIDIEGVRNAWVEPSKDYEVPLWMNYNHYEEHVDLDCDCNEKPVKICRGRLQLDPVTQEQFDGDKAGLIARMTEKLRKIESEINEYENQILTLNEKFNEETTSDDEKEAIRKLIEKI